MAHLVIASFAVIALLSVIGVVLVIIPDRPDLRRRGLTLLIALSLGLICIALWT